MKYIFILVMVIMPLVAYSQYNITGHVKDTTGGAIEFANIILTNQKNEIVTGVITDKLGKFEVLVKTNRPFYLIISFIGYDKWKKEISIHKNTDLGVIILNPSKNELDEVVVIAKKPLIEQKADRIVFNIADNSFAQGKNALKTIGLAPMVWVSSKGDISINGKGGVGVVVNGKLLPNDISKSYLRSLRSEDIERIEIIPNPPAEYEAKIQCIINIILKENIDKGFKSNLNISYTQQRYASLSNGISLNYKTEKWLWYGSYNYSQDKSFFDREVVTFYKPDNNRRLTNFQSVDRSFSNSYRFGFDYDISSKQKIGVEYYASNLNFDEAINNEAVSITNTILEETGNSLKSCGILKKYDICFFKYQICQV